ncbi:hypothetical protein F4680DRAFT_444044 [Xylaria scruposa]|nr:hypothetical protein F4680DRAFT_444044 [Xylaria scruposa]
MLSLLTLPNEILEEVVDLLVLDSRTPYTTLSLAFVNRLLRELVHYCQHRVLYIPPAYFSPEFLKDPLNNPLQAYFDSLETRNLLPAVRTIKVTGSQGTNAPNICDTVCQLVPKVKGLRDAHVLIPVGVPPFIEPLTRLLVVLRSHKPPVRVNAKLRNFRYGFAPLQVFCDFSNLYALEYALYKSRDSSRDNPEILPILRSILITCPNLRILKLYTRTIESCRRMRFSSYEPTYTREERPRCLENVKLPGDYNDDSWFEEFFDWSKLSHLRIKEVALLPYLANKLTALKSFEAPNVSGYNRRIMRNFFAGQPSRLECIKLPLWNLLPLPSLMKYGPTLRALHFTHSSMLYEGYDLTAYKIKLICAFCPCLEEFELSVRRQSGWPVDIMEALTNFPKLRSLTIITRFCEVDVSQTPDPTPKDLTRPFITFKEVRSLYNRLAGVKAYHKNQIRRLCYRCLVFTAEPAERDDEAAQGLIDITCAQVSMATNRLYKEAFETGKRPTDMRKALPADFCLPYWGPLTRIHSNSWPIPVQPRWDPEVDAEGGVYRYEGAMANQLMGELDEWGEETTIADEKMYSGDGELSTIDEE